MRSKTGPKRTKRQKVIPRGSDAQKGQFRRPLGAPKWTPERVQKSIKNHSRNLLTFRSHLGPVLRPMSLDFGAPNRPKFCRRRLCDGHDVNICAKPKNTGFPECFWWFLVVEGAKSGIKTNQKTISASNDARCWARTDFYRILVDFGVPDGGPKRVRKGLRNDV